jgi:hypothetical protein
MNGYKTEDMKTYDEWVREGLYVRKGNHGVEVDGKYYFSKDQVRESDNWNYKDSYTPWSTFSR